MCLVCNKIDLKDTDEIEVTNDEGKQLAQKHNLVYYEVSAKTGFNVNTVFEDLANTINEKVNKRELENNMEMQVTNNLHH